MTFTRHQVWTALMGAAAAAYVCATAWLIVRFGRAVCWAAVPVGAAGYFFRRLYLRNVNASRAQAEQARRHVAELTHYIGEQERVGQALQQSEAKFRNAFDHAPIGMALVSPTGSFLRVNRSLCEIVGYKEQELLETNVQALTDPADLADVTAVLHRLREDDSSSHQIEVRYAHQNGHSIWVLVSASLIKTSQPAAAHFILQIQNITDRKRAEEQLTYTAFHDSLTNLPNRALFTDRLNVAFRRAKRNGEWRFAILFLDFDRFKVVNDSLGHLVGDQLLVAIAERLRGVVRAEDTMARLGGDEFAVLLEDLNCPEGANRVAEKLQEEMSRPFVLHDQEIFSSLSIGIAIPDDEYNFAADLLRDADTAMYQAKRAGGARSQIFEPQMYERALNLMRIESDLRRALEREEFRLVYQPIVALDSRRIVAFEALIRWVHPTRGLIPPAEFISVLEETNLMMPVGRWVLAEACRQLKIWQGRYGIYADLSMSVNVSPKQLLSRGLVDEVRKVLEENNVKPHCLKLEITESAAMENLERAESVLQQLSQIGVKLSIDDFGTGYSSLSYLQRFPVNFLKIDRSFVSHMTDGEEKIEMVRTIVALGRNLNMELVAEGVETEEQLLQLQKLACQYGQGYLFSRPVEAEAIDALLDADKSKYASVNAQLAL